ncbi:hypothetical protein G6F61_000129 [Rhizopus arrhizus]|nr:hypothetical protein G6F42_012373 [Rhizopus arrhizus]KAG1384773.1 hypothetical protein G6F61_000129 [Rhizopus arrhizus]
MEHARLTSSTVMRLLLDQQKTHDQVHPAYLCQALRCFTFPSSIVNMAFFLHRFFSVKGPDKVTTSHRSRLTLHSSRSCDIFYQVLMSLDSSFHSLSAPPGLETCSKVKFLAYADDGVCFLNDPHEVTILHEHFNLYAKASGAKINFNKTEAASLSGSRLGYQRTWRTLLLQQQIHSWHDSSSREPVIYLGFPLHPSIAQRDTCLTSLLSKIMTVEMVIALFFMIVRALLPPTFHSLPVGPQVPIHLNYRQAFAFPSLRPKALAQSLDGVFSLFFTAVDNLPHLFDQVVINPQTALCLQLDDVSVFSSSCPLPKSISQLPRSLAYKFDSIVSRLQPKSPSEISIHPYLTKWFLKWIRLDQLKLQPFFIHAFLRPDSSFILVTHSLVDISPFLVTWSLVDHPGARLGLTSRRYRRLYCPSVPSSCLYPNRTSFK